MTLSMNRPFSDMEIEDVEVLKAGVIYKLTGHAGEALAIKVEMMGGGSPDHVKNAKIAMRSVSPEASEIKLLTDGEKQALRDWVAFIKRVTNDFAENKIHNISPGLATKSLGDVLEQNYWLWYKMPVVKMAQLDTAMHARMSSVPDKGPLKLLINGLKEKGGLEQIGKIVAADFFNQNGDRFDPYSDAKEQYGGREFDFRAIRNPGNILMIAKNSNQRMVFSGHDILDTGVMNLDISEVAGPNWLGNVLCDAAQRKILARNVVSDFEMIFTPNKKSYSPFSKLGSDAYKRVEAGMILGMRNIVGGIDRRYKEKGRQMQPSLKDRRDRFDQATKR